MTDFGFKLVKWSTEVETFSLDDAVNQFPNVCKRKIKATLMGSVVAGYINQTTLGNGQLLFFKSGTIGFMTKED